MSSSTSAFYPVSAQQAGKGHQRVTQPETILRAVLPPNTVSGVATYPLAWDMQGFQSWTLQTLGGGSVEVLAIEGSNDGISWGIIPAECLDPGPVPAQSTFIVANDRSQFFAANKVTRFVRVRRFTLSPYTTSIVVHLRESAYSPKSALDLASAGVGGAGSWSYLTAAGGIIDTTPVEIVTQGPPSSRNCVRAIRWVNEGTAPVTVTLRQATGGIDLYRWPLAPFGSPGHEHVVQFEQWLRPVPAMALQIVLSTGTNVKVHAHIQGSKTPIA